MQSATSVQGVQVEERKVKRPSRAYSLISLATFELSRPGVKAAVAEITGAVKKGKKAILVELKDAQLVDDMCYWEILVTELDQLFRAVRPHAVAVPSWAKDRIMMSRAMTGGVFGSIEDAERNLEHWPKGT